MSRVNLTRTLPKGAKCEHNTRVKVTYGAVQVLKKAEGSSPKMIGSPRTQRHLISVGSVVWNIVEITKNGHIFIKYILQTLHNYFIANILESKGENKRR